MSEPNTHPAIAAVLAVTPRSHDGSVTVQYGKPWCGYDACTEHNDIDGPAEPIAARQAAAVLRWLADDLAAKSAGHSPRYRPTYVISAPRLHDLADEIDPPTDAR